MDGTEDQIERSIEIDAPAERVWELISEPGWWINDGSITEHKIERVGDVDLVHDGEHGTFAIRTVQLDEPRYAAFRWLMRDPADDRSTTGASTLVEFWIVARADGGVTVRVVESGFSGLDLSAEKRRRHVEENTAGWEIELGAAQGHLGRS